MTNNLYTEVMQLNQSSNNNGSDDLSTHQSLMDPFWNTLNDAGAAVSNVGSAVAHAGERALELPNLMITGIGSGVDHIAAPIRKAGEAINSIRTNPDPVQGFLDAARPVGEIADGLRRTQERNRRNGHANSPWEGAEQGPLGPIIRGLQGR